MVVIDNQSSPDSKKVASDAGTRLCRPGPKSRLRGGGERGAHLSPRRRRRRLAPEPRRPHHARRARQAARRAALTPRGRLRGALSSTRRGQRSPGPLPLALAHPGGGMARGRRPGTSSPALVERYFLGGAVLLLRRRRARSTSGCSTSASFCTARTRTGNDVRSTVAGASACCPEVDGRAPGGRDRDRSVAASAQAALLDRALRAQVVRAQRVGALPSRHGLRPGAPSARPPRVGAGQGAASRSHRTWPVPIGWRGAPAQYRKAGGDRPKTAGLRLYRGPKFGHRPRSTSGDQIDQPRHVRSVDIDQAPTRTLIEGSPPRARGLCSGFSPKRHGIRPRTPRNGTCGPVGRRGRPRTARTAGRGPGPPETLSSTGATTPGRSHADNASAKTVPRWEPGTMPLCATPDMKSLHRVAHQHEEPSLGRRHVEKGRHPRLVHVVGRPLACDRPGGTRGNHCWYRRPRPGRRRRWRSERRSGALCGSRRGERHPGVRRRRGRTTTLSRPSGLRCRRSPEDPPALPRRGPAGHG